MPQGGAEMRQPRRSNPKGPPQNPFCGECALARRVPKVYFENGVEVAYRDYLFDKEY